MPHCQTLIRNVLVVDGSGGEPAKTDVAVDNGRIVGIGELGEWSGEEKVDGAGFVLAPGFIDTHTHDDIVAIRQPEMLPKLTQGVTTVIAGNCGISAAPVRLKGDPPPPMNLLGEAEVFAFPTFADYRQAVDAARPAVNLAAFVGHTALRNNHMDRLDRVGTADEIDAMRGQLQEALDHGALGLSTGLAYLAAYSASTDEVMALAELLADAGAIYVTHMRTEAEAILLAMEEAFGIGRGAKVPVIISHLKCAGIDNWGRSDEVLAALDSARYGQDIGCDCYPYAASSTILDVRQIDERMRIVITWSTPHPEMGGRTLSDIADEWGVGQKEAAERLRPAGAIYHSMSEDDMRAILCHPATMVGSDGLPNDPRPHPRLWGTFPRVLGRYCRDLALFPLAEAIHKMTGLSARRFGLNDRGLIREGMWADLVLFDAGRISDAADFEDPIRPAEGIHSVWVNGVLSYRDKQPTGNRAGRFLPRQTIRDWK